MPILDIDGQRRIQIDDSFLSMTPEQQNATVDEIAKALGITPRQPTQAGQSAQPAQGPWTKYQKPLEGPWTKYQQSGQNGQMAAPGAQARRLVEFEGRQIDVPGDATDDEIRQILNTPAGQASPPASTAPRSNTVADFQKGTGAFAPEPLMGASQPAQRQQSPVAGLFDDLIPQQPAQPRGNYTLADVEDALRNADAAGDVDAARQLADEIVRLRGLPPKQAAPGLFDDLIPQKAATPQVNQGLDAPTYLGQSSARGVAGLAGAPVDLMSSAMNVGLMGADALAEIFGGNVDTRITKPVLGSQWIRETVGDAYEGAGGTIVPPEAVSPGVRITGEAIEAGTGAALGGLGLASGAAQTAAKAGTRLGRGLTALAQPYRNSVRPVVGDTVTGAGSGAAVGAYDEVLPESAKDAIGPIGPLAAALAGGVGAAGTQAVAQGTADRLGNVFRNVVEGRADPASPYFDDIGRRFTRQEMDEAARAAQVQASDPVAAARRIREASGELADAASPGSMPTTGALSDDIGLTALEREARVRNPVPFAERDRAVATRAGDLARSVAPDGSVSRDFTDTADQMFADRVAGAKGQLVAAKTAQTAAGKQARLRAEPIAREAGQGVPASQRLDAEIVGKSMRPMQERKNAAFEAIDPDRTVVRDARPLIQAAEEIRDSLGRLNDPSSVLPTRTLDRIVALGQRETTREIPTGLVDEGGLPITRQETATAGGTGTITYGELNALRPELGAALIKARAAGDFVLADNIQALQRAINREGARLASEATPAGQRAAEAQRIYSEEFAPVWNTGPGDAASRFRRDVNADRAGRTLSPPSATAERFLRPGEPEKAQSLRRIIQSLPDGQTAQAEARRYLTADLAESGVVDASAGMLRPDMLRRWRNKWGASLDVVPGFRDELDDLLRKSEIDAMANSRLAGEVRAAEGRLDSVTQNKGALGLVLGKDPVNAVTSVFGAGDPERAMRDIVSEIGSNRRASDGLKSSVVDYLVNSVGGPNLSRTADKSRPLDFGKLENLFSRHERTLAEAFTPEEMSTLRRAHRLLAPKEALQQPGRGSRYESAKGEQAWRLLEGGLKAHFGVLKGGGILRTIRIFVASLPRNDDAVNDILVRMHFDPELASHLLTRSVSAGSPQWNQKLNKLLAIATGARENVEEDGADAPGPLELTIRGTDARAWQ